MVLHWWRDGKLSQKINDRRAFRRTIALWSGPFNFVASSHGEVVTMVLPEFVPAKWWQNLLYNQNTLFLKGALLL